MTAGTPSIPTTPPAPVATGRWFRIDNRFLAPILITCILAVGDYEYQLLESYWRTAAAIVAAIALELVLGRWATGRWPHLASAYITGISVGILLRSTFWWPFILCSMLSISSKYALRVGGRHLWNPSNLGMSVLLFLAPQAAASLSQQWGNDLWPLLVIWLLGSIILYRLGRLHITLSYVAAFIALSFVHSTVSGEQWINEVAPLTGPMYQLYIFFMITDPPTTTKTRLRQCAAAVLVAVVETILRLNEIIYAPYYALFLVSPATNLLEIWWIARRTPGPSRSPHLEPPPIHIRPNWFTNGTKRPNGVLKRTRLLPLPAERAKKRNWGGAIFGVQFKLPCDGHLPNFVPGTRIASVKESVNCVHHAGKTTEVYHESFRQYPLSNRLFSLRAPRCRSPARWPAITAPR